MKKDLISIKDLTPKEIEELFNLTDRLKEDKNKFSRVLAGKTLALIFQKPSNRTRVSFEVGMYQLGGNSIYLSPAEINLGVRESVRDVAKTLSRYVDAIVIRTFEHKNVLQLAEHSDKPVINGLSDFSHPCQGLADVYTVRGKLRNIKSKTLAFIGDGNNVCNSLIFACAKTGLNMNIAAPTGYEPDKAVLEEARVIAQEQNSSIKFFHNPAEAVKGVDVVYTDVWASMGQEEEAQQRKKIFREFQVNSALMSGAKRGALIMHCLPAHRGDEITDEVIDSPHSVVFDQAENRMHVQKAILITLLGRHK
ncbi:MAG: ornithine carbamoyltransferase [Candidatus Omnitrophica bacterium]|nr:ornithine carbamoyltransferase [Candidatus Omnitrophota bacterium]